MGRVKISLAFLSWFYFSFNILNFFASLIKEFLHIFTSVFVADQSPVSPLSLKHDNNKTRQQAD
jgi:hypothetical protein